MDSGLFAALPRKVLKVCNVVWLKGPHLAPGYSCETFLEMSPSKTGHARVFEVKALATGLPRFVARWDETADALDIDIMDVTESETRSFKNQKSGYSGHHSSRLPDEPRAFEINVQIPGTFVCRGVISLNLVRGMSVGGELCPSGSLALNEPSDP